MTGTRQGLYFESDDDEAPPELMAVRHKSEWLTIPDQQQVFMEHELSEHSFEQ